MIGVSELLEGLLVFEVVLNGRDGFVLRDMEVIVEVAAEGRVPWHGPSHARFEGLDFSQRRAGDQDERGVASMEMREVADVVRDERAARATLVPGLPGLARRWRPWLEHEVIHDELTVAIKQIEQTRFTVRA